MQDLGGYGITAQSFEFLCTLDKAGSNIAPGLRRVGAESDGTVSTFKLRQNVKWT